MEMTLTGGTLTHRFEPVEKKFPGLKNPGNLSWRRDLNSQPTHYKCVALPIAPLQHRICV